MTAVSPHSLPRSIRGAAHLALVVAGLVAACLFLAPRASAAGPPPFCTTTPLAVVAPSTFEACDGNLLVNTVGHTDWASVDPSAQEGIDDGPLAPASSGDSQFGSGMGASKQLTPGNWSWINAGSVSPPKSNLLNAVISHENVATGDPLNPEDVFLYAAFHVQGDSGNTNADIELNQIPFDQVGDPTKDPSDPLSKDGFMTTTAGSIVPARQPGDLLITYDGSFGDIHVGICKWVGPPQGQTVDPNAGWYAVDANGDPAPGGLVDSNSDCTPLPPTLAIGATNQSDLPNAGIIPNFPNPIPSQTFGELSINLSNTLVPTALSNAGNPCFSFGSFWMHTRSSSTVTADTKDFITPRRIPAIGSCAVSVDKVVKVHGSNDAFADSNTASVGDTLDYELRVENTGTVTLDTPLDVTDAGCSNLSASPTSTSPTANDTTFDPGDVWTYTCDHATTGASPGGTYTNDVSVVGHKGAYDTPEATDSATTTFRAKPSPNTTATITGSNPATSSGSIGDSLTDSLDSFSNASGTPTGTVTFKLYKINTATVNAACTTGATLVHTSAPVSINGGLPVTDTYTPTATNGAGTYQWVVSYSGDANNDPGTGSCTESTERATLAKVTPSPVTAAKITGSNPASQSGPIGSGLTDDLTGFTGNVGTPTGTATFRLYKIDTATVNAACTTGATLVHTSSAKALSGSGTATDSYTPSAANGAGTYQWVVSYDGSSDPNNASATGSCTDTTERVVLTKVTPAPVTSASADGTIGTTTLTDQLTGFTGNVGTPTGTATFRLYKISDTQTAPVNPVCTTAIYTSPAITITAQGTATGASYKPTAADGAGVYQWVVTYTAAAGELNNNSSAGTCNTASERTQLAKVTPAPVTSAHPTGGNTHTAAVGQELTDDLTGFTGAVGIPVGTATFRLYKISNTQTAPANPACTTAIYTSAAITISAAGTASASYTPTAADGSGIYQWIVTFTAVNDPNNNSSVGVCNEPTERVAVDKAHPSIATVPTPKSAKTGTALSDTGDFANEFQPTGTVTYTLYKLSSASDTTCDPGELVFTSAGNAIANDGTSSSGSYTPTATGTYQWIVSYGGDANNEAFTGACPDASEQVTVDDPQVAINKAADKATAHEGDTVNYTITVTNPGTGALHDVVISDPKCASAPVLVSQKTGAADDSTTSTLDPGDTWTYKCSATMPAGNSFTNTATVTAKDPRGDTVGPKDSSVTTTIVHPAIKIDKTGPASATAGDSVTFTLTVTNPGDIALSSVKITDDKCPTAPALQSQKRGAGADPSPGTLDPGDTWTYTCTAPTAAGNGSITNTAKAEGTDPVGKVVSSTGAVTIPLVQPQQAVLAETVKSGVADFVSKPKKCVTKKFNLDVKGTAIAKVTFKIDGKKVKALAKPDAQGRYRLAINPLLRSDARHTVTAEVTYTAASKTAPKTLKVFFKRCACISRRAFTIRLRKQFHQGLKSATVFVNKKRVKIIRGAKRLKAPIKLVGLPKGRVTVKINAVTLGGKRVTGTRHYLTCNKKLKGGIPKL